MHFSCRKEESNQGPCGCEASNFPLEYLYTVANVSNTNTRKEMGLISWQVVLVLIILKLPDKSTGYHGIQLLQVVVVLNTDHCAWVEGTRVPSQS